MSFEETLFALRELMAKDDLELGTVGNTLRISALGVQIFIALFELEERRYQLFFLATAIVHVIGNYNEGTRNINDVRDIVNRACQEYDSIMKGHYDGR